MQENAEHTFEVLADDLDEDTLWYKNRKVSSKAIHAAALCPHRQVDKEKEKVREREDELRLEAWHCVRALLEHGADVKSKARPEMLVERDAGPDRGWSRDPRAGGLLPLACMIYVAYV